MPVMKTLFLCAAAIGAATASSCSSPVDAANFTVALIRAPPPNWPLPITNYDYTGIKFNISEGVDSGINLIHEAQASGSNLVVFPELWFPGCVEILHHLAPFPYLAGRGDNTFLWWENEWINTGAVGTYSVLGGTYSFTAAVGASFVTDPMGNRVAHAPAAADFDEMTILYHSLNTTGFNVSQTYNSESQTSWGTLSQIVESFPGYVPEVEGDFVKHKTNSIVDLVTGELVIPT